MFTSNFYGIPYYLMPTQNPIINTGTQPSTIAEDNVWLYFFSGVMPESYVLSDITNLGELIAFYNPVSVVPDLTMEYRYDTDVKQKQMSILLEEPLTASFRKNGVVSWMAVVGRLDETDDTRFMFFSDGIGSVDEKYKPVIIDNFNGVIGEEYNILKVDFIIRDLPSSEII